MEIDKQVYEDLLDALLSSLPFLEDMLDDPCYKDDTVKKQIKKVNDVLIKSGYL